MSISDVWKAPIDLLEQELWSVEDGLLIVSGWVKVVEYFDKDILEGLSEKFAAKAREEAIETGREHELTVERKKDSYINISSGEKPEEEDTWPYVSEVWLAMDRYYRLWDYSDHDFDHKKRDAKVTPDEFGVGEWTEIRSELWTKTYFIHWALRHRFKLPWLEDATKEGYIPFHITGDSYEKFNKAKEQLAISDMLLKEDFYAHPDHHEKPWDVIELERETFYQLTNVLRFFKDSNQAAPNQNDVLEVWKKNPPTGVTEVTDEGLMVKNRHGKKKPVNALALGKAIKQRINFL